MADVLLTRGLVALTVARGVGEAWQGRPTGWMLVAAALGVLIHREGLLGLTVVAWMLHAFGPVPSGSFVLLGWVALACWLFRGVELERAVVAISATVYLFAGANKLTLSFLSGERLHGAAPRVPIPEVAGPLAVVTELLLAVLVWRRVRWALPLAAVAHVSFVAGMATSPAHAVSLAAFNGAMLFLVWWGQTRNRSSIADMTVATSASLSGTSH